MSIKTTLNKNPKKDKPKASKLAVTQKTTEKKQTKSTKQADNWVDGTVGRSAVNHVKPHASRDVRGTSGGLINTGTIISYEEE